jgi:hypothetical protein
MVNKNVFIYLSISFPVVRWLLVFSHDSCWFTESLELNSYSSYPLILLFPLYFRLSSSSSSFHWPGHHLIRPSVILHVHYMSTRYTISTRLPVFPNMFVLPAFFLWWICFLLLVFIEYKRHLVKRTHLESYWCPLIMHVYDTIFLIWRTVIVVFLLPSLLSTTLVSEFRPSCQYTHVYVKSLM